MAFIRKKTINGNTYFYLVETIKKRQKVKKYLGKQIPGPFLGLWKKRQKGYF